MNNNNNNNSNTTVAQQQRPLCIENPHDVSNILFSGCKSRGRIVLEPFVGPIQVVAAAAAADENKKNVAVVVHGRGVVATRPIHAGELLFASSPCIQAEVATVKELWKRRCFQERISVTTTTTQEQQPCTTLLEACTEEVLVQAMLEAPMDVVASFMCLVGSSSTTDDTISSLDVPTMNVLNVQNHGSDGKKEMSSTITRRRPARDQLLRVIRHNAFGPDGLQSYDYVERMWRLEEYEQCQKEGRHYEYLPPRLLGIYPLAAMLNHSCLANAVRVYAGDVMLVHAASDIATGQEVVWSYLPPTLPYAQRWPTLQNLHGFVCRCPRCVVEQAAYQKNDNLASKLHSMDGLNQRPNHDDNENHHQQQLLLSAIALLENDILRDSSLSNEMRRYLRVGYTQVYIRHFNAELASLATNPTAVDDANKRREALLMLCMQLHFSFCACHNASTEHLSVCTSWQIHEIERTCFLDSVAFTTDCPRISLPSLFAHSLCYCVYVTDFAYMLRSRQRYLPRLAAQRKVQETFVLDGSIEACTHDSVRESGQRFGMRSQSLAAFPDGASQS
jgi:SET domain